MESISFIQTNHSEDIKETSAIRIQKNIRGYLARRSFLARNLYPDYKIECMKAIFAPAEMPRAYGGITRVYLPIDTPQVILKKSGKAGAIQRFHQMQEVRSVLNAQKSSHLIIPKARLCGEFLVEERLPINAEPLHNAQLYLSHPEIFDQAVSELTRLFSQLYLTDLIGSLPNTPLSRLVGDLVRSDNLPLYFVERNGEKEGRIGLIDLEHMEPATPANSQERVETLTRIFPLHLEIIKKEATANNVAFNGEKLETIAAKGKSYLDQLFTNHYQWLKQKNVVFNGSSIHLNPANSEELISSIKEIILKTSEDEHPSTDSIKIAAELTPEILSSLLSEIQKDKKQYPADQILTDAEFLSCRSVVLELDDLAYSIRPLIKKMSFPNPHSFAKDLALATLHKLKDRGEIFTYITTATKCWIQY